MRPGQSHPAFRAMGGHSTHFAEYVNRIHLPKTAESSLSGAVNGDGMGSRGGFLSVLPLIEDQPDQAESVRPGDDAGQKKSDDDRQAHPVAQIKHDDRQQDDDQDVVEVQRVHLFTNVNLNSTVPDGKCGTNCIRQRY